MKEKKRQRSLLERTEIKQSHGLERKRTQIKEINRKQSKRSRKEKQKGKGKKRTTNFS